MRTILASVCVAMCAIACGGAKSPTAPSSSAAVTSMSIVGFSVGNAGFSYPFAVIVQYSDGRMETSCPATNPTPGCTSVSGLTWSSSNPQVATISSNGVMTTLRLGPTTITATVRGKSATWTFNVI
jgi:Bacterial Ig-like domain (group 2)